MSLWKRACWRHLCPVKRRAFASISLWPVGFQILLKIGRPDEGESQDIYCTWWEYGHYGCCSTGHIHVVGQTLTITEEFLELVQMTDTRTWTGSEWTGPGGPAFNEQVLWKRWKRECNLQMEVKVFGHFTVFCIRRHSVAKSLKMDHIMEVVVRTVNFIQVRSLNPCQIDSLLSDKDVAFGTTLK